MKHLVLAGLLAAVAAVPAAQANELSYSYLEGGYLRTEPRHGLGDAEGWRFGGSAALGSRFHLFGSHSRQDVDLPRITPGQPQLIWGNVDVDQTTLGFGYHHPISDRADLVAQLAYEKIEMLGLKDEGGSLEVGLRGLLGERVEGWAMLGHVDARYRGSDTYARLGGQYKFSRSWGLVAEGKFHGGDNQFFFGPRLSF
jgi:Ax21 family sulfation-dependent quorum factor